MNKFIEIFIYLKYFIYFNFLLFFLFTNYIYYKISLSSNIFLINALYITIDLNGSFVVKFIQWIVNNYNSIDNKDIKFFVTIFSNFFENNKTHCIQYTYDLINNEFSKNFFKNFVIDNNYKIKSGSIAQIYKIKCIENFYYNDILFLKDTEYAMKIVHPNIKYQSYFSYKFLQYFNKIFLNKILNIQKFYKNFILQTNMNNEYNNIKYFYNEYIDNSIFIIPKPFFSSNNILIMEFIEGEIYNENMSKITNKHIFTLLNLFYFDMIYFKKYIHCDLHIYNWKIINYKSNNLDNLKIIIYDFGFVVKNNKKISNGFKNINYNFNLYNISNDKELIYKVILELHNFFYKINITKDKFLSFWNINFETFTYNNSDGIVDYIFNELFNISYKNNLILKNNFPEIILVTQLLSYNMSKYTTKGSKILDEMILYLNICNKFNIFQEMKTYYNNILSYHIANTNNLYTNKYFDMYLNNNNNINNNNINNIDNIDI
jgi:predicted unusual protein kinase regulating ubiquinone biosynthesis (AarF/ABC1/UbiB family)